jgi:hypothetical protein
LTIPFVFKTVSSINTADSMSTISYIIKYIRHYFLCL